MGQVDKNSDGKTNFSTKVLRSKISKNNSVIC